MNDQAKQYQQLIAKCWADDAFKQRLLADPAGTLAAEGMAVPEGVTVRVVENSAQALTLVIPARPTELTDEALEVASGGVVPCAFYSHYGRTASYLTAPVQIPACGIPAPGSSV